MLENAFAAPLNLLAHQTASFFVVTSTQRLDQALLPVASLPGNLGRQDERVDTLRVKDLPDRSVFFGDFRQQRIAGGLDQQFVKPLLQIEPSVHLSLVGVFLGLIRDPTGDHVRFGQV